MSDVLRDRVVEPAGLHRMMVVSAAAHALLLGAFVLSPAHWLTPSSRAPKPVMTIVLSGGNGGPANGGVTPLSGRAVQAEPLAEPPKRPEPIRPPAEATPKMTVPIPTKMPVQPAKPAPAVKNAPDDARGRTPTRGDETRAGSAIAETGARGQGFGLSSAGGVGLGARLDVSDFCCPDYIVLLTERIRANWNSRAEVARDVTIKYTIQRDGTITATELEKSSGYTALDLSAQRAVMLVRQLPPLPAAFPNPTLTVHSTFQYSR